MRSFILLPVLLLLATFSSFAQIGDAPLPRGPEPRNLSMMIDPFYLIEPVLKVTGEYRADDDMGFAGMVAIGDIEGSSAYMAGVQLSYYLLGDFRHGMQLGGELLYAHVGDESVTSDISGWGNGVAIGPYIGYKYIFDFGFTLNLQGGLNYNFIKVKVEDNSGQSASGSGSGLGAIANVNVGWSF